MKQYALIGFGGDRYDGYTRTRVDLDATTLDEALVEGRERSLSMADDEEEMFIVEIVEEIDKHTPEWRAAKHRYWVEVETKAVAQVEERERADLVRLLAKYGGGEEKKP